MAKLIWTEESLAWLSDIDRYLVETSYRAVVSVLEGIIDKAEILCDHPRLGAQVVNIAEREVREVLYGVIELFTSISRPPTQFTC
jgi:plasmid stabilization system protein ParE